MSRALNAVVLVVFSVLLMSSASAQGLKSAEIVDKKDRDGDGYVSEFKVRITADLKVDEAGGRYGDGVLNSDIIGAGYPGRVLEQKGDPKFNVWLRSRGSSYRIDMWDQQPVSETRSSMFTITYDYDDVQKFVRENSAANWIEGTEDIARGRRPVTGLWVQYYESDSCSDCSDSRDEKVEFRTFNVDNFRLERPSKDRKVGFSIDANTEAKLYINGEKKGRTPWTGDLPVDIGREGLTDIRLEAKGYKTETAKEDLSPPGSRTYRLEKVEKPLVVDSDPEGATVRVNGQKIGETPVSKDYWVNEELDVRVEGENDTESFQDVTTPWRKTVRFGSTDYSYGYGGLNFGSNYYGDLVTDLPDLSGLTVPAFAASKKKPNVGETIEFNASDSYSISYNITSYSWDMGDGTTETGETVSHSYSSPGNYTVNLTVENSNGTESSTTRYVVVRNVKPKPVINLKGKKFVRSSPVSFSARPSVDPDGTIVSYRWNFGDGSTTSSQTTTITHVYSSPGTYTVELTVTDSSGASSTARRKVRIEDPNLKPSASFSYSPRNPEKGEAVSFDASASSDPDGTIQTYSWNLGNGLSRTGKKISYNFSRKGNYTVELIAIDSKGASSKISKTVSVTGNASTGAAGGSGSGTASGNQSQSSDTASGGNTQASAQRSGSDSGGENVSENNSGTSSEESSQQGGQGLGGLITAILSLIL